LKPRLAFSERKFKSAFSFTLGKFLNWQTFLILTLFAIAISWIPDGLYSMLSQFVSQKHSPYIQVVIGFGILIALFLIGNHFVKKQLPSLEIFSEEPRKRKNLILFLSPSGDVSQIKSFEDFKNIRTPWQMPATAIKYHLPKLENIFVILGKR